jgi:hypothetical protein
MLTIVMSHVMMMGDGASVLVMMHVDDCDVRVLMMVMVNAHDDDVY